MTAPLTCISDWTNPAGWTPAQRSRKADLWDLFWTATPENTASLVGKKIVAFQPAVPIMANGLVVQHPYPQALATLADKFGARTNLALFRGADGGWLQLLDLTRPRFPGALAQLRHGFFGALDGHKHDYHCRPDSLGIKDATGALVTWTTEYLEAWDRALSSLMSALRALKPDAILIGQCDRMTGDTWGATSGCYIEQRWNFNGRTAQVHASDLKDFAALMHRAHPERPMISVLEIREPEKCTANELDLVRAWCIGQGIYLSLGRDAAAVGVAL